MTGEQDQTPTLKVSSVWTLAELYVSKFGMLTFGTLTLILLHLLIFDPMLERNQISIDAQRSLVAEQASLHEQQKALHEQQKSFQDRQKTMADHMESTAKLFDSVLTNLLQQQRSKPE